MIFMHYLENFYLILLKGIKFNLKTERKKILKLKRQSNKFINRALVSPWLIVHGSEHQYAQCTKHLCIDWQSKNFLVVVSLQAYVFYQYKREFHCQCIYFINSNLHISSYFNFAEIGCITKIDDKKVLCHGLISRVFLYYLNYNST